MQPVADGELVIYGAWYFSQVIAEAAEDAGWKVAGFVDPDPPAHVSVLNSFPHDARAIVAIGDNDVRAYVYGKLAEAGRSLASVVHTRASVSPSAVIGPGCYIAEFAVVRPNACVGAGTFVNPGAVVSHDCTIGAFVTLGPNAATAGHVSVGDGTTLGVGSSVRPHAKIGRNCQVGAGSAVASDIADGLTVAGVPARAIQHASSSPQQSDWQGNSLW